YSLITKNVDLIYVFMSLTSIAYSGQYVLLLDFVVEVTYPYNEGTITNIANCISMIPSLAVCPLLSKLIDSSNLIAENIVLIALSLLILVISLFVKNDLRRQKVNIEYLPLLRRN
ncbi:feline leukemia virus subgroup C receptor-related protein 2-like protein, partial [Leptotrombidium deliense]